MDTHEFQELKAGDRVRYDDSAGRSSLGDDIFEGIVTGWRFNHTTLDIDVTKPIKTSWRKEDTWSTSNGTYLSRLIDYLPKGFI
jgi:hypothetical protein